MIYVIFIHKLGTIMAEYIQSYVTETYHTLARLTVRADTGSLNRVFPSEQQLIEDRLYLQNYKGFLPLV